MVSVEVSGDRALALRLDRATKRQPEALRKGIERSLFVLEKSIKHKLTGEVLKVRSGNLRKSITRRIEGDRGNPVGRVGTNLIYARIHELGGTIRPVRAKYLHFRTTDGGWIKTKKVIIPRRPYMAPSLSENLQKIVKIIRESVMEGFKWASATGY